MVALSVVVPSGLPSPVVVRCRSLSIHASDRPSNLLEYATMTAVDGYKDLLAFSTHSHQRSTLVGFAVTDADTVWIHLAHPNVPGRLLEVELTSGGSVVGYAVQAGDGGMLTAKLMRDAPWLELERAARHFARRAAAFAVSVPVAVERYDADDTLVFTTMLADPDDLEVADQRLARQRRPNRAKHGRPEQWTELRLAQLAEQYVKLCADTGRPNKALGDRLGLDANQVRNALYKARKDGILSRPEGDNTKTRPGLAGGELLPKGRRILNEQT